MTHQVKWMPVCERGFGAFTFLWGVLLVLDAWQDFPSGLFFRNFERYMPGWAWGSFMIALAAARLAAYYARSSAWRLRLSAVNVSLFAVIAMVAVLAGLFAVTFPLAAFLAVIGWWCHGNLAREIEYESRP
jgi:hypothetical protein